MEGQCKPLGGWGGPKHWCLRGMGKQAGDSKESWPRGDDDMLRKDVVLGQRETERN